MDRLLQFIDGKSVAVVGNGPVEGDVSREVDACDVVIRFNHMYRYGEGTTGKKISAVLQTFTGEYMRSSDRHNAEILKQRPEVFLVKQRENYAPWSHAFYGPSIRVNDLIGHFREWWRFTTGGAALCYFAKNANNSSFKVFGFPGGAEWEKYIATDAHWYKAVADEERRAVDEAKRVLAEKRVTSAPRGIPKVILVPVKRSSSGAPGKNRKLLMPLLEKLEKLPYRICVCGDDPELLCSAELAFPGKVQSFHVPAMQLGSTEDVTVQLRNWRDGTGYCGDIALVQCTSADLKADWVERCFEESSKSALVATAVPLGFKPNAIYQASYGGVYIPLNPAIGPASRARQNLPVCCRITGAVEVFHSDALDWESFWQAAYMRPCFVDGAVDIDTPEQLAELGSLEDAVEEGTGEAK